MRKLLLPIALLAVTPVTVLAAEGLSYTYVEGGAAMLQIHSRAANDPELGGGYLRGSFAIGDSVHLLAGYSSVSDTLNSPFGNSKVTLEQTHLGLGYHVPISNRVDFTSDIAWIRRDSKSRYRQEGGPCFRSRYHADLGMATFGVRGKPSTRTEAWLNGGYLDGGEVKGEWVGRLGGRFDYSSRWSQVMEIQAYRSTFEYSLGLRLSF